MAKPRLNLLERAVGLLAPRRAYQMAHLRWMDRDADYRDAYLALLRARGYRAAATNSQQTPWLGTSGDADSEIRHDLPKLRNRCRELNRDDPLATGLTGTFVNNVIAGGLTPQARTLRADGTLDVEKNRTLEAVWNERRNALHPADHLLDVEAQRLEFRKVCEDGELLVKLTKRSAGEPLWFEQVEADRLVTPTDQQVNPQYTDGVERDADGVPVAYHILRRHPGNTAALVRDTLTPQRVPAAAVCHLKLTERPGQTRGVPLFHAIVQDLRDLDLLLLASLKRVQIAALLAAFIKSGGDIEQQQQLTARTYGYVLDQRLEPGMIWRLYPDEEVQTLIPNFPTPELQPFVVLLCRRIGAALGVSWQVVLKDFSQSSYSSARTDLLETRQVYTFLRNWYAEKCLAWKWRAVLEDARLRGDARLAAVTDGDLAAVTWIGDAWQWIDPDAEVKALQGELENHISTVDEIWLRLGKDPDEMRAKLRAQAHMFAELGIRIGTDPGGKPGGAAGPAANPDSPPVPPGNADTPGAAPALPAPATPAQPGLNGAQITAAVDVFTKLRDGALVPAAALELLVAVGLPRAGAEAAVTATPTDDGSASALGFVREMVKLLAGDPATLSLLANLTDLGAVVELVGLPRNAEYTEPYLAVPAPAGPLVSGETIKDAAGDIVGAAVLPNPAAAAPPAAGTPPPGSADDDAAPAADQETEEPAAADAEEEVADE